MELEVHPLDIIIFVTFYSAYIFKQAKLRGVTNKIIWRSHKPGHANVVIGAWNRRKCMLEMQFQTNVFSVFYERCL